MNHPIQRDHCKGQGRLSEAFIEVAPSRLELGKWCEKAQREKGTGDICGAYSADLIGMQGKIRRPSRLQGWLWATVGMTHQQGSSTAKAYRLSALNDFEGTPTSYSEKDHSEARKDPMGFYHGMTVSHGGHTYVFTGPPTQMLPGSPEPTQPSLF